MQIVDRPDALDRPPCVELLDCFERAPLPAAPQVATKLTAALAAEVTALELSHSTPASDPSPASPPSPSGIQTASTFCPSANPIKYRTVPSTETNFFSIRAAPTETPRSASRSRNSNGSGEMSAKVSTRCR